MPETVTQCANCKKSINPAKDANTWCRKCDKYFCFAMFHECFCRYHRDNHLLEGHRADSIASPEWVVKVHPLKESHKMEIE